MRPDTPEFSRRHAVMAIGGVALACLVPAPSLAASASEIATKSRAALDKLYADIPKTRDIGQRAKGIMVFPNIIKGGLVIAGSSGDGVLLVNDQVVKYFNISSASFGFQAGAQGYGYALFFMNDQKLAEAQKDKSWDIGADPNVVLIDMGAAKELDTTSLDKEVYAFVFDQKGLMAGISLKGSRTKEIHPD